MNIEERTQTRRTVLTILAGLGIGSPAFQRAVASQAADGQQVTAEMLQQAEWIAGLELTDAERDVTLRRLESQLRGAKRIRDLPVDYTVPPSVVFEPAPFRARQRPVVRNQARLASTPQVARPESDSDLAFLPVTKLAILLREQKITSVELTKVYLERLKKYDRLLHCVVTLTESMALKQAQQADAEIAAGEYRGPLHGVPWGAKDLMAVPRVPYDLGRYAFSRSDI